MWLEAVFSRRDLEHVLTGLTPTTMQLGAEGELHLDAPEEVTLVAGHGLRVVCRVKLRWSVLGIHVPVTVTSATVLLEPSVEKREHRDVLAFRVTILALDVAKVPHLLEGTLVERLNAALAERHAELVWDFKETLSHRFDLPTLLGPPRALDLTIAWGELRITDEALVFAVSVHAEAMDAAVEPRPVPALTPDDASREVRGYVKGVPVEGVVEAPFAVSLPRSSNGRARLRGLTPLKLAVGGGAAALTMSILGIAIGTALARRRRSFWTV